MQLVYLDHLVLTVRDGEAAATWYERVLGMRRETFAGADGVPRLALHFGDQKINLHVAGAEIAPHAAAPTPGSADLCFRVVSLADAQAHLAAQTVVVELGPVPRTGATGPMVSLYLRDPDGNLIELSEYSAASR